MKAIFMFILYFLLVSVTLGTAFLMFHYITVWDLLIYCGIWALALHLRLYSSLIGLILGMAIPLMFYYITDCGF